MGRLTAIRLDRKAEVEGILFPFDFGIKLRIARAGNPKYDAFVREFTAKFRANNTEMTEEDRKEMSLRAAANTVLVGWENYEDDNDNPVPYSPEKAYEILADPEYIEVQNFVYSKALNTSEYRVSSIRKDAGN